jgi:hypothetical protein
MFFNDFIKFKLEMLESSFRTHQILPWFAKVNFSNKILRKNSLAHAATAAYTTSHH